jgi:hypothetical protein
MSGTAPNDVFPEKMTEVVYRLGYNAKASYGAHSFLIRRLEGNAMVDAPRWTKQVVEALEQLWRCRWRGGPKPAGAR